MVKLENTQASGACAERFVGSTPTVRTKVDEINFIFIFVPPQRDSIYENTAKFKDYPSRRIGRGGTEYDAPGVPGKDFNYRRWIPHARRGHAGH